MERKNKFRTMTEYIFQELKDDILYGGLLPGQVLLQDEIAAKYEVSRIPVREALRMLAAERLIEMKAHRRAAVRDRSTAEIADIFLVKSLLEPWAAATAVPHLTDQDIELLRSVYEKLESAARRSDLVRYVKLNREFHITMYKKCGSSNVLQLIEHFFDQASRFVFYFFAQGGSTLPQAQAEHLAILRACESRDANSVRELIREHSNRHWRRHPSLVSSTELSPDLSSRQRQKPSAKRPLRPGR
jgi:DNA-binding GntR family transcriptional regulator